MSIAAGFKCSDGVILATDLEITEPSMLKRPGGKGTFISDGKGLNIGIVGAGEYDVLAYACEIVLRDIYAETFEGVVDKLRRNLNRLYRNDIRAAWPEQEWGNLLQLLVGVTFKKGTLLDWGLYMSDRSVLRRAGPYDFVGIGKELAYYIVGRKKRRLDYFPENKDLSPDPLDDFFGHAPISKTLLLAKEVVTEVIEHVSYCGKGCNIMKIPYDGQPMYVD